MALLRDIRVRARQVAPPVLAACMVAYFAYHAVQGERGLLSWHRLKQDIVQARMTDTALAADRARLALRVRLLHPGSLDPDLLEERAHAVLGYGRDDEVMILLPEARASQR